MAAMTWGRAFVDADPLTIHTIVQLQLEDSEEFAAKAKGKQREDVRTDAQIAMEIYVEDLKKCDAYLRDRNMAQSLAMAVMQDGDLIAQTYQQEQQLAEDHELATRLAGGEWMGASGTSGTQSGRPKKMQKKEQTDPWEDREMLEKAAAIYMQMPGEQRWQESADDNDSDGTVAESSSWAASHKRPKKRLLRICIACGEEKDFYDVARVPCDHEYCRTCLESLFTLSMKDETLFPPRCDGREIPLGLVRIFLPSAVARDFELKYDELSTQNRTYCHERSCTAFIPNDLHADDIAYCPKCSKTTCAICKGPSHSGDCPEDEALQQLIKAANAAQWQRCYQCNRFVELDSGCNHMRCKCGADFCYVCGERWKTCACEQWDERRLYGRAAQIVDRNPSRRLFQPAYIADVQPATRPPTPMSIVAGPSSALRELSPTASSPAFSESDFLDSSDAVEEWSLDTQKNLAQAEPPASNFLDGITPLASATTHQQLTVEEPFVDDLIRNERIAEAVEHLRNYHQCAHGKWRWIKGQHQCEECSHMLKEYIFECRLCQLRACNRCRRNRL